MAGLKTSRARATLLLSAVALAAIGFVPGLIGAASANTTGTDITSPSQDTTITDSTVTQITVSITRTDDSPKTTGLNGKPANPDDGNPIDLTLTDPNGNQIGSWSSTGNTGSNYQRTLPASSTCIDPRHGLNSCNGSGSGPLANGTYVLHMTGGASGAGGSRDVTRNLTLRVPPAQPQGLSVSPYNSTTAHVSWSDNSEPDRTGYDVLSGGVLLSRVSYAQVCSSGLCSENIQFSNSAAAGSHSFTIKAYRLAAPGSNDLLVSPESDPASTNLSGPAPSPKPTPTPTPTQGGGDLSGGSGGGTTGGGGYTGGGGGYTGGGGTGGSGGDISGGSGGSTGGSGGSTGGKGGSKNPTVAPSPGQISTSRHFVSQSFNFAPISGIVKLPQLPSFSGSSSLPGEAPEPQGTFAPTLAYGDQEIPDISASQQNNGSDSVVSSITSSFKSRALAIPLAGALLLLLVALHVRDWMTSGEVNGAGQRTGKRKSDGGYDW